MAKSPKSPKPTNLNLSQSLLWSPVNGELGLCVFDAGFRRCNQLVVGEGGLPFDRPQSRLEEKQKPNCFPLIGRGWELQNRASHYMNTTSAEGSGSSGACPQADDASFHVNSRDRRAFSRRHRYDAMYIHCLNTFKYNIYIYI